MNSLNRDLENCEILADLHKLGKLDFLKSSQAETLANAILHYDKDYDGEMFGKVIRCYQDWLKSLKNK